MRISTLLLSVATLSVAISASGAERRASAQKVFGQKAVQTGMTLEKVGQGKLAYRNLEARKQAPKSRTEATAPTQTEIVTTRPAGELTQMSRSSFGYYTFWGMVLGAQDAGLAVDVIKGDDGKVWFNMPFSQFPLYDCYFYGIQDGNVITIPGGQPVYQEADYDDPSLMVNYYLCNMEFVITDEEEQSGWMYPAADIDYKLIVNEDGTLESADPEALLGLAAWDDEIGYDWVGYGDYAMTYENVTAKPLEAPDAAAEPWACINEASGSGYFVNVAKEGDAIYLQGLYSGLPEAWVKLDVVGQQAIMARDQYLGIDPSTVHFVYASAATTEEVWDPDYEEYVTTYVAAENLAFEYDAENNVLASNGTFIVTPEQGDFYLYVEALESPRLAKQNPVPGTPPANPYDLVIDPYDDDYGYGTIDFYLPCLDTDGNLLDAKKLYYRLFVDGEPYTFYADEYVNLPEEEMSVLPYDFTDNYDIYAQGASHTIYFYFTGFDTMGVQSFYMDGDKEVASQIVEIDLSGVKNVAADNKEVKAVEYYDLQGRRVANPEAGLYIRRTVFADGSFKASKIAK